MEVNPSLNPFINDDFLLETESAKLLYHNYAKELPIIDYHSHLSPKAISENKIFNSISSLWLSEDHYKWRALRTLGVDEKYITGKATNQDKFIQFASMVPFMVRNPLYHWTHLELQRYFDISELLSEKSADRIYDQTNKMVNSSSFSTLSLLERMKVERICSTDDPLDSLEHHINHSTSGSSIYMNPTFRPDKSILINAPNYNEYIDALEISVSFKINSFEDLCEALQKRIDFFHKQG